MTARSGNIDQAAQLGKLLNMKYAFGKSITLGKGEYGNAILTKNVTTQAL